MGKLLFVILYLLGCTISLISYFVLKNERNKKVTFRFKISFSRLIYYHTAAEIFWFSSWLVGVLVYTSTLTLLLGLIPMGLLIRTWGLFGYITLKESLKLNLKNKKEAKVLMPVINQWASETGTDLRITDVVWDLVESKNRRYSGRIVINVQGSPSIDWNRSVIHLKEKLNKGISVEVILNNKLVYPRFR